MFLFHSTFYSLHQMKYGYIYKSNLIIWHDCFCQPYVELHFVYCLVTSKVFTKSELYCIWVWQGRIKIDWDKKIQSPIFSIDHWFSCLCPKVVYLSVPLCASLQCGQYQPILTERAKSMGTWTPIYQMSRYSKSLFDGASTVLHLGQSIFWRSP